MGKQRNMAQIREQNKPEKELNKRETEEDGHTETKAGKPHVLFGRLHNSDSE